MNFETILLQKENNIGKITLNRPDKRNAISRKMMEELIVAIEDVVQDDSVRLVLLTGAGKAFCAGADTDLIRRRNHGPGPQDRQRPAYRHQDHEGFRLQIILE